MVALWSRAFDPWLAARECGICAAQRSSSGALRGFMRKVACNAGLAPNLEEARRIRIGNAHDKQDDTGEEGKATAPKQPPRGTAVTIRANSPNGERVGIARGRIFPHLSGGKPKVERSRDDRATTQEDCAEKQEERASKCVVKRRREGKLFVLKERKTNPQRSRRKRCDERNGNRELRDR